MTSQLRIYRIKDGHMEPFVALWRDHIVAARAAYGFIVDGAWTTQNGEFAWIVSHPEAGGFAAADKAYYDSAERAALPERPADHIEAMELRMMEPVSG